MEAKGRGGAEATDRGEATRRQNGSSAGEEEEGNGCGVDVVLRWRRGKGGVRCVRVSGTKIVV
jgi:hypothetical protein